MAGDYYPPVAPEPQSNMSSLHGNYEIDDNRNIFLPDFGVKVEVGPASSQLTDNEQSDDLGYSDNGDARDCKEIYDIGEELKKISDEALIQEEAANDAEEYSKTTFETYFFSNEEGELQPTHYLQNLEEIRDERYNEWKASTIDGNKLRSRLKEMGNHDDPETFVVVKTNGCASTSKEGLRNMKVYADTVFQCHKRKAKQLLAEWKKHKKTAAEARIRQKKVDQLAKAKAKAKQAEKAKRVPNLPGIQKPRQRKTTSTLKKCS